MFLILSLLLSISGIVVVIDPVNAAQQYRGNSLGKLNSYHHQVSADVFAIDEYTLLLAGFTYDGTGTDTFFWAGASTRPGPQGFIVPNEYGKTDVLNRYLNKDIRITLPDRKKITDIKWFAVYDLTRQSAFGDVYIPEEFEPPVTQTISQLTGRSHGVTSGPIEILDAKTITIPQFTYNGAGQDTYFWVGLGPQPSSKGYKVPDENGYLDPLRVYTEETVTLELPGDLTIFDIDWLSIYDVASKQNLGYVIIPDEPNVPPSLSKIDAHKTTLPNCVQLHKRMQVGWEIFGPQITIQLAGLVDEDEYMAFGTSGAVDKPQMLGSDVTIAYIDGHRGYANDYNITAESSCTKVLGQYKGVCKDELVGGQDNNQLHTAVREDGVNIITYRRTLISPDIGDKEYKMEGSSQLIWAIGKLFHDKEPAIHSVYPRGPLNIELHKKESINTCFPFVKSFSKPRIDTWERTRVIDKSLRTFTASLGPSGGKKGYEGITNMPSSGLVWYIDGKISPEVWMRRGYTYSIYVHGGNNPHSAEYYNPLIITDEPHGGYERLSDQAQKHVKVLAGVQFTLRGQARPTAVGPLCLAKRKGTDMRLDDRHATFKKFNRTLTFTCESGEAAVLDITPNSSWPDTVYYNSFTRVNTGWKIHIVDSFNLPGISGGSSITALSIRSSAPLFLIVVYLLRFPIRP
ncbi:protein Skeletor, isoforms B/C [Planococcus citri]|uniref:protein Skeletor, isoforms B/C n=1 Tax=Planococcus citri TaxID=170843 RepID=UPI0031F855B5